MQKNLVRKTRNSVTGLDFQMQCTNLDTGFLFQSCLSISALSTQWATMNPKEHLNTPTHTASTDNDYTWQSWEAEPHLESAFLSKIRKNVAVKINNLTLCNFCNLLMTVMESLKTLEKGSVQNHKYGIPLSKDGRRRKLILHFQGFSCHMLTILYFNN